MKLNDENNQSINNFFKRNHMWQNQNRDLKVLSNEANKPDKIQMQKVVDNRENHSTTNDDYYYYSMRNELNKWK